MQDPPDTTETAPERRHTNHPSRPETQGTLLARVSDLHLHFDTDRGAVKALDGVNFDVHQDELFALVGETGCGKTVTARSFMQLVPTPPGKYPSGEIRMRSNRSCNGCGGDGCERCDETGVEFDDLLSLSKSEMEAFRGDRISMIFQDPQTTLNPSLPIRTHLAESILAHHSEEILEEAGVDLEAAGPAIRRVLRNRASAERTPLYTLLAKLPPFRNRTKDIRRVLTERSIELLYQTQVPNPREVLDNYAHELSGGQQQRVMIAIALAAEPDLLIADEATTALDVTTQARILKLLKDLQEEYNTGLLYITHDLNLVHEIADRVAVMYAGSIAEMGDVDAIYDDPKHPYTQGLINSVPREEMVGKRLEGIEGTIPDLVNPRKDAGSAPVVRTSWTTVRRSIRRS
ncbi:ABC transporter ATP-binding protein [Saliphagus sp. GCM10025308]